jgi:hypothetical protein
MSKSTQDYITEVEVILGEANQAVTDQQTLITGLKAQEETAQADLTVAQRVQTELQDLDTWLHGKLNPPTPPAA